MIDLKSTTPPQENLLHRMKSRNWLESNLKDIQEKYADKWIAIAREQIVAHGNDPDETKEKIKGEFPANEVILVRVPTGESLATRVNRRGPEESERLGELACIMI